MNNRHDDTIGEPADQLAATAPLAEVRADLDSLEAIEDEIELRVAELRAVLPPGHFRLVWGLQDAEQRLGVAERLLAERHLVAALARGVPEHAATIRTVARTVLGDGVTADTPA